MPKTYAPKTIPYFVVGQERPRRDDIARAMLYQLAEKYNQERVKA